ncbi:hypothetical protein F5Y16DRAFT_402370 [Xylariaceae sp. FL0255]|nr:hypothetical protein F5Y16DRAFT_402370 [Xylariaceae sp. FL0255]
MAEPKGAEVKAQAFPFMRLPSELRLRIWEMAIPHRDVVVGHDVIKNFPPAVLQTRFEARLHLRKRYTTSFQANDPRNRVLINYDVDTVYLSPWLLQNSIRGKYGRFLEDYKTELRLIKNLIVDSIHHETLEYLAQNCDSLESLKFFCAELFDTTVMDLQPRHHDKMMEKYGFEFKDEYAVSDGTDQTRQHYIKSPPASPDQN